MIAAPLRRYDRSDYAEVGIVLALASERWIRRNKKEAVFIDGLAWRSSTPWFEGGGMEFAKYARDAFESVEKQAGFRGVDAFDILEVDDTYSYKLVQHLISLGVSKSSAVETC